MHLDREVNITGLGRVLQDWTPDEVAASVTMLARFNHDIERREGREWPRPPGSVVPSTELDQA